MKIGDKVVATRDIYDADPPVPSGAQGTVRGQLVEFLDSWYVQFGEQTVVCNGSGTNQAVVPSS